MKIDMNLFEVITEDKLSKLSPGDWIWDNKIVLNNKHERSLSTELINEPIGFRQIHILDLKDYPSFSSKPFMLSDCSRNIGHEWVHFEPNRFYMFKKCNFALLDNINQDRYDKKSMMAVMAGIVYKLALNSRSYPVTDSDLERMDSICSDLGYWEIAER